jgi:hypothetical protein
MRKVLLVLATFGTLAPALVVEAQAVPAPRIASQADASLVTQVRDHCGYRRHWSPRYRRCIWNSRGY